MSLFTELLKKTIQDFLILRKKWLIGILVFFVILYVLDRLANHYIDKVVAELIVEYVNEEFDGFYEVQFDEIAYILNSSKFYLTNFEFDVSSKIRPTLDLHQVDHTYVYHIKIPSLLIEISDLWAVFIQRKLKVKGVEISDPLVEVIKTRNTLKVKKISPEMGNLYEGLSRYLSELSIVDFKISNSTFDYQTLDGPDYNNFYVEGLSFEVRNFQLNEESAIDEEKFFYTDDILLQIDNQVLYLRDSVHQVTFDRFYISTKEQSFGFDGFKLGQRAEFIKNNLHYNKYLIEVPELKFEGVDFVAAYHKNMLLIDSIQIIKPLFQLVKETKVKRRDTSKVNILDVMMLYHDHLAIEGFKIEDASIQFTDKTSAKESTINLNNLSSSLSSFRLDTGINSNYEYGLNFDDIDLTLDDFEVTLPDSSTRIAFDQMQVKSNPLQVNIDHLMIHSDDQADQQAGSFDLKVPNLKLTGFDVAQAMNKDILDMGFLTISQPSIEIKTANENKRKNQSSGKKEVDQPLLRNLSKTVFLDSLIINQGNISLSDGLGTLDSRIDTVDLKMANVEMDSSTSSISLIKNLSGTLALEGISLNFKDQQVDLNSASYDIDPGNLLLRNIDFFRDSSNQSNSVAVSCEEILVAGIDPAEILSKNEINLDALRHRGLYVDLRMKKKPEDQPSNSAAGIPGFPIMRFGKIEAVDQKLNVAMANGTIFRVEETDYMISGLHIDPSISDKPINKFDYQKIDHINVRDYSVILGKIKHRLDANAIIWNNQNSTLTLEDIELHPTNNDAGNKYNMTIPEVSVSVVDFKKVLKGSYYESDGIRIDRPTLNFSLAKGKGNNEQLKNIDLGFIPLLLRNRLLGVETNSFEIVDAQVNINVETDSDSLHIETENLNLDVVNFAVDSNSTMKPGKFLFANDVRLSGDYFSAYHRGAQDFYNINHFFVSTLESDISLEGIYFSSNTGNEVHAHDIKTTADALYLVDLDFYQLLKSKRLKMSKIEIDNGKFNYILPDDEEDALPEIKVNNTAFPDDSLLLDQIQRIFDDSVLVKSMLPEQTVQNNNQQEELLIDTTLLRSFNIDEIDIEDISINLFNKNNDQKSLIIPDLWLNAQGISYDPGSDSDPDRIFYSDYLRVKVRNFNYLLPDKLSKIAVGQLYLDSRDSLLKANDLEIIPVVSKYEYGEAKGYQSTWLKLKNDSIIARKVDFLKIINDKTISAEAIDVHRLDFSIFRDKRIPFPEWQRKPLPQVTLGDMDYMIDIDTTYLSNSYVNYQEFDAKANAPGEIFFDSLNATVLNITNDQKKIRTQPHIRVHADAIVYGQGKINANFMFDMQKPENIHTYGIQVDAFDITEFNRILVPNAAAQVKSGQNQKIILSVKANEDYSYGEMKFYYNDLKIQLLNRETETIKGIGPVLGSFFANTFFIRTNNPKNFVLRKGDIFFERDKKRAIFNYWVKSFLSGVVSSVGAVNNKKKIRKMQKDNLKQIQDRNSENLTVQK